MLPDLQTVLLKAGVVDAAGIQRAVADHEARGGNLVEALVRLSLCDEMELARLLAKEFSVPLAESVQFDNLPVFVTRLVPAGLARTHRAVPLVLDRGVLHVAMSDPTERRVLQDIAVATGHIASPVVAPVSLLASALTRYFPAPTIREASVQGSEPSRARSVFSFPPPATGNQGLPAPTTLKGDLAELFSSHSGTDSIVTLERPKKGRPRTSGGIAEAVLKKMVDDAKAPAQPYSPAAEPLPPPASDASSAPIAEPLAEKTTSDMAPIQDAEQALASIREAASRDEVARLIVRYAAHLLPRVVLLAVKNEMLVGWMGGGAELVDIQVKGIMVPLGSPSVFKTVRDTGTDYFGTMPRTVVNDTFLAALGQSRPEQVILIPISIRHRPIAILYGDCGRRSGFSVDLSTLHLFSIDAGAAFERVLLSRKLNRTVIR